MILPLKKNLLPQASRTVYPSKIFNKIIKSWKVQSKCIYYLQNTQIIFIKDSVLKRQKYNPLKTITKDCFSQLRMVPKTKTETFKIFLQNNQIGIQDLVNKNWSECSTILSRTELSMKKKLKQNKLQKTKSVLWLLKTTKEVFIVLWKKYKFETSP